MQSFLQYLVDLGLAEIAYDTAKDKMIGNDSVDEQQTAGQPEVHPGRPSEPRGRAAPAIPDWTQWNDESAACSASTGRRTGSAGGQQDVQRIHALECAFAAVLGEGLGVTGGDPRRAGDSRQLKNAAHIQASRVACDAMRSTSKHL